MRGQYNQTYLDIVAEIVEEASSYGIYTLADMHEDVLSERFWYGHDKARVIVPSHALMTDSALPSSGEGIPGWASQPNASTRATFPEPLGSPFTNDPATGFPTRQDCAKHGWGD